MQPWRAVICNDRLLQMRRPCVLLITALSFSWLGHTADFAESDKIAIDQLLDRYVHAYSVKDYAVLKECFQTPWVQFPGPVNIQQTVDDVINVYRNQLNALEESNYDHSQFLQSRIIALSADRALVNKTYRRYRKDGTVLLETAGIYIVSKSSGKWKITGFMPQDLKEFNKIH